MKRKGIEPNEVRKYFLITGAFLIFMIGCLLFFLSWLQKDVEINSQKNVATYRPGVFLLETYDPIYGMPSKLKQSCTFQFAISFASG